MFLFRKYAFVRFCLKSILAGIIIWGTYFSIEYLLHDVLHLPYKILWDGNCGIRVIADETGANIEYG